jgi:TolB-like protein
MSADKGVENSSGAESQPPGASAAATSRPVFISYASADAAQKVCSALEAVGILCWIAPRDVVPGTLYADGIVGAIDESRILVLIISKDAVDSAHVGRELERAASKRHPILALKVDATPLTRAFEYFLNQSHWIEVGSGRIEAAVPQLVEAVCRHLDSSAPASAASPVPLSVGSRVAAIPLAKWILAGGVAVVSLGLAYFVINHFTRVNHTPATTVSAAGDRAVADSEKPAPAAQSPPVASIAVLPFSDLSAEGNQGYFSDGMSEEILNVLAHVNGLRVASRTSSFQFRKSDLGAPAIAARLGVRHILEGSVRKAGNTVRVTAQLIDASTDQHLWSQSFDRPMSTANLFAIQDEIAKNIVDKLAAR